MNVPTAQARSKPLHSAVTESLPSARRRDRAGAGHAFGFPRLVFPFRRHAIRHVVRYERVLGTGLELQIIAARPEQAHAAETAVLREIDRLETIFSAYRADSELRRWEATNGSPEPVSPELAGVLQAAEDARRQSSNAFHPAVEALTRLWREASARGSEPDAAILKQTVRALQSPLWEVDADRRTATRWTHLPVTLNAIAKGFIVDRACAAARAEPGVSAALVNIGGDIRQSGGKGVAVGVADPFAHHDNVDPIAWVRLRDQGIATSGGYRRGFPVGQRWYSHLIDPRTGCPVENVISASVIAENAQTADTLATTFSVLPPDEGLRLADRVPGVGVLLIAQNGERYANALWAAYVDNTNPRESIAS